MIEKILNCPGLPTFPAIATELLEMSRDPNVAMGDIARLIKTDQGLAGRVLKTVNSSFFGLGKPCTSIERALGYLGLKVIKSLVLGFSMVRVTRGVREQQSAFDMQDYWRRTICAAAGARQLAVATGACDADEAFTAGLFQDMGVLASYVAIRDQYEPVLAAAKDHSDLPNKELDKLGFTHAEVGARLAEKWRMSEALATCVRFHHEPDHADEVSKSMVRVVAWGRMAADALTAVNPGQPLADLIVRSKDWFGWENNAVEELLDKVSASAGDLANVLEQKIGEIPDVQQLLAKANEILVEQQLQTQREAEQLQEKAQQLEKQTTTDALTGAANRKRFDQEIARLFEEARREKKALGVLFVDADKFKSVNDTHGHQAGDAVLVELASRMMRLIGQHGAVCRYGGEEFAVILPNTRLDKAARVGELLRKTIAERPFDLQHVKGAPPTLSVTVSVGVSSMEPDGQETYESAGQLVLEADKAVYVAKHGGRNCVRWVGYGQEAGGSSEAGDGSDAAPAMRAAQKQSVLVVEPDALAARLLKEVFEKKAGVSVRLATSGEEAFQLIKSHGARAGFDIVLCEFALPDGDGCTVIGRLKTTMNESAPTWVILTKEEPTHVTHACLAAGAEFVYGKSGIAADPAGWCDALLAKSQQKLAAA